ncbi:MAG: DUF2147 domain-containing protein [Azospira oryzae]|nr:MAG: DUF2147 domain-containing protein [Azospira oryzae]
MRKIFTACAALFISLASFAQPQPADKIIGVWQSTDSDVGLRFEIFKQGDKYFGKLQWASTMYEADGKTPKADSKNPDEKLRSRSRQNITNVTNLTYEEGEYTGGKLYNPDDGDTYSLKAKLKSTDLLEFRGYVGISLLGKTMKLKRIQ